MKYAEMGRSVAWITASAALLWTAQAAFGQALQGPPFTVTFTPANGWMATPVLWSPATDRVPPAVRTPRDQYFDTLIGLPTRLTAANARPHQFSEGATIGKPKEIPDIPNRAVAIVSFLSSKPVVSASGRSIYTEVALALDNIFQDPVPAHAAGPSVTLIVPGGTVETSSGEVISFLTVPKEYFINPGKTYLIVMAYHSAGDFYMLAKAWDLSSGKAERNFATPPSSSLIGQSTAQIMATLNQELGVH